MIGKILRAVLKAAFMISALAFASRLFAADAVSVLENATERDIVVLSLDALPPSESMHYSFMYGFQAVLEKKCNGALLTFTEDGEYVAGYLSPDAPDDFCTRIEPDTIATAEPLMRETLILMYQMLGDRSSVSLLLGRDEKAYAAVMMFLPEDGMVLTPMWYAEAENRINAEAVAHGINPEDVFSLLAEEGFSKDDLVASVAAGESPEQMILDALMIKKERENSKSRVSIGFFSALFFGLLIFASAAILIVAVIHLTTHKKGGNKSSEED